MDRKIIKQGKIRECYIEDGHFFVKTSDRISIRDQLLPFEVKGKGKLLNAVSKYMYERVWAVVPVWFDKQVSDTIQRGKLCEAFPVEFVVRSHLTGTMYKAYQEGKRRFSDKSYGKLRIGMKKKDHLGFHYLEYFHKTPTGDKLIETDYQEERLEKVRKLCGLNHTELGILIQDIYKLFDLGKRLMRRSCPKLTIMDTKFEFGRCAKTGQITLIDEVFTPDCTRYGYEDQDGFIKDTVKETVRQRYEGQDIPSEATREDLIYSMELSKEYVDLCSYLCTHNEEDTYAESKVNKYKHKHYWNKKYRRRKKT